MTSNGNRSGKNSGSSIVSGYSELDPQITSLMVDEEARAQIAACLQRLMADTGASYCMVIDRAGQILDWESDEIRPEMVHLGALLAATYASTQEMARILKQDGFKSLFQEGLSETIFTETVQNRWLLVVIFDQNAHVGLVKVLARRASQTLSNILDIVQLQSQEQGPGTRLEFGRAANDSIDRLFHDKNDDRNDE